MNMRTINLPAIQQPLSRIEDPTKRKVLAGFITRWVVCRFSVKFDFWTR